MRVPSSGPAARGAERFRRAFNEEPGFDVFAPGRVVLMGDHIDHAGLPVLPMALERGIRLTVHARRDALIRLRSADARFGDREFVVEPMIATWAAGDWGNYAKAAVQELHDASSATRGFDALVDGDLPVAAGLSSSSALVIAFALAFLRANDVVPARLELAERLAAAERYVGTRGGGMDQAIGLCARAGAAARIGFDPLTVTHAAVPTEWRFIIAHSLVTAEKSGAAMEAYNTRVRECREAFTAIAARSPRNSAGTLRSQLALLGEATMLERATALPRVPERRLRHVITEAGRVRQAIAAMEQADTTTFGRLMNESHASLRDDFQVSIAPLNQLVEIAQGGGATGARLSGAGFGGCVVALARDVDAHVVMAAMAREFYEPRRVEADRSRLFIASPGAGARIIERD